MEFTDNPAGSKGAFHLKYGKQLVGVLSYENNQWTFQYSNEFRENLDLNPIIDFPDPDKVYIDEQLWPFFASRIPSLNQPFQFKKIQKASIKQDDSVGLLKLFGSETINNPFRLFIRHTSSSLLFSIMPASNSSSFQIKPIRLLKLT